MINIFLVDDSLLMLHTMKKALESEPDIRIVGTATNGRLALEQIPNSKPNVVITDLHMPVMDGHELVSRLMQSYPLPILVVSVAVSANKEDMETFRVLEAGAMDILPKPAPGEDLEIDVWQQQLKAKIRVLAGVIPMTRRKKTPSRVDADNGDTVAHETPSPQRIVSTAGGKTVETQIICIGASTGGPMALKDMFSSIPSSFPYPICCAMHISRGFSDELIAWLNSYADLQVVKAQHLTKPKPGRIYFPPDGNHLSFNADGAIRLISSKASELYIPCVDMLYKTAAESFGSKVMGVILTGMGRDGAKGLLDIRVAGGKTFAQDEASSVVYGMPMEAVKLGAVQQSLSLPEIAKQLCYLGGVGIVGNRQNNA